MYFGANLLPHLWIFDIMIIFCEAVTANAMTGSLD